MQAMQESMQLQQHAISERENRIIALEKEMFERYEHGLSPFIYLFTMI